MLSNYVINSTLVSRVISRNRSTGLYLRGEKEINYTIKPFLPLFNAQNLIPFRRYSIMSAEMNKHGK